MSVGGENMVKSKNEVNSNYGEKSRGNILIQNNDKCATNCIIPKKSTKAVFFVLLVNFIVIIAVFGSFYLSRPSEYKVTFDGAGGELPGACFCEGRAYPFLGRKI